MDIPRKGAARKKLIRRTIFGVVAFAIVVGISLSVNRLQPALPSVEGASIWRGTVRRGPMIRQVRGLGSLIPEDILWIPARTDARVDKIRVLPGSSVKPDTVILELSSPELESATMDAEYTLKAAEAALTDLEVQLKSTGYDKEAAAAVVTSDYKQAQLTAERDTELAKNGLLSDLDLKLAVTKAEELKLREGLEKKRLGIIDRSVQAQLEAQRVKISQLKADYELKKQQVNALKVRAGTTGVLQQLGESATPIQVGQQVKAGSVLAKIVEPQKLKAELKITETEAKDIALGQEASVDTRNGVIPGRVIRIDPAAVNGTVAVDVGLLGPLPQGARPDLSVEGTIQLEKLDDVLFVERPTAGQPHQTVGLFRIDGDGKTATRVQVQLGRASVNTIEVLKGLSIGDTVILSDMSAQESHDRIRLN